MTNNHALIQQGQKNIEFAQQNMDALMNLAKRSAKECTFKNTRIAMSLHLTKETAVLARVFTGGGAKVAITSSNLLTTQNDVVAALKKQRMEVYGQKGESRAEYFQHLKKVLEIQPHVIIDDGGDLTIEAHKSASRYLRDIIGGTEETTTGVLRARAMQKDGALRYPVIAVNDNYTKHLMDNYYGTGQSTIDGIMRASNVLFAGKTVVVAGYGSCGKGVALRAKGMGSNIIVTEVKPFRALQAVMDGFRVMSMQQAAPLGDIFITVTGDIDVICQQHMTAMKNGAILANSGHFNVEIDMDGLDRLSQKKRRIRPFFDEYTLTGKNENKVIYVIGEGRLANLVAAEGHPSEVMAMSFCGQALAVEYLLKNKSKLKPGVYTLPEEIDEEIAILQLDALNVKFDSLSTGQKKYLAGWSEGT